MSIRIDGELCTACESCINACPYGGIEIIEGAAVITGECNLCGACVDVCPIEAIILERAEYVDNVDKAKYQGVWVIAEHYKKEFPRVVYQLVGKGRELADTLNTELSVIILGDKLEEKLDEFGEYGVDEVVYVRSPILKNYYSDLYVNVLSELISQNKPEIILIGATPTGRDFAPRVAKRLKAGLTADCTGLYIEDNTRNLMQTRPTFGGNLMATIRTPTSRPQMATVRPGIFKAKKSLKKAPKIRILEKKFTERDSVTKILKIIEKEQQTINLEDAEIIVAGGRGVGSKEGFELIRELASVLGAELGGSRVTIELNWLSQDRQVGQTGKTVSPKLYIACGISGAIQHLVGMENSQIIIAINKDPHAPIFSVAHYGIVGDLHQVIPALIDEIKKVKAED
ncbi:MAG: 4Fe-4S dicluster domain-containing protein [Candidatus Lokiarchaeota archaeon]|nr:4Fe-4S dicluster domain-containing protein [Candidatus Lokiarchaeota archaeon]